MTGKASDVAGMDHDGAEAIARAFVAARRSGRALEAYPGPRPEDLAAAYAIQDLALRVDGRPVIGWKVGRINPPRDTELGANRLAGPIFAGTEVVAAEGEVPDMPVFAGGFAAGEAELLLHIAPGQAGILPADDAETWGMIDEVRLGIEIASSPWQGINADGPTVTASDFGNNNGLVLGAPLPLWRELDLCAIPVRTEIAGQTVGEATAATMLDGPFGAVRFLLRNLKERGIEIPDGTWVSTGAITGVHPVVIGQEVRAIFGVHGEVRCRIVAAPRA